MAIAYGCDETGASIWTPADAAMLAEKNGQALDRIRNAGDTLNKISTAAEGELEKN